MLAVSAGLAQATAPAPAPCDYLEQHHVASLAGRAVAKPTSRLREAGPDGVLVQTCVWKVQGDAPGSIEVAVRRAPDASRNQENIRDMRAQAPYTHPEVRVSEIPQLGDYAAFRYSLAKDHASVVVMQGNMMIHISAWQLHMGATERPALIAAARKILRAEGSAAAVVAMNTTGPR